MIPARLSLRPARRAARGFSLVEAVITMLLVAVGLLTMAATFMKLSRAEDVGRQRSEATKDPLAPLTGALAAGDSLILFPEGTRDLQPLPGPFKAGLFHLAERFPEVELVPVYLENLHRCMPKGTFFPVPLICTVRFGAPLARVAGEDKADFLERARRAVIDLA